MHVHSDLNSFSAGAQPNAFFSPFSSSGLIHANVSKIAQESLREIKRLRILLARLLTSVELDIDDPCDEDADHLCDDKDGKKSCETKIVNVSTPASYPFDNKSHYGPIVHRLRSPNGYTTGFLNLHKLTSQISETLETLDQLASRFQMNRLSSRFGELGLMNAISVMTTLDQLEFGGATEFGDSSDIAEHELRRSDWVTDRADAERWSNRYWERTQTIMEGLLSCSVFRRSHMNSDLKRNRVDSWSGGSRDFRADLEHLLTDVQYSCPRLSFTLIDSGSSVLVVHVKVGDVMQCFVTFRRLHPETLIVRGLTECVFTKSTVVAESDAKPASRSVEELLCSKLESPLKDLVTSLISPDHRTGSSHDARAKRAVAQYRQINISPINIQQLDLVTPSRLSLFQRITLLARCALLHFSNDYQPPSAVRGLFVWLHSYHDLFTAPCGRCGQLLGQDVSLPVWRTYPQLRKDDGRSMEAQHEHCQATL